MRRLATVTAGLALVVAAPAQAATTIGSPNVGAQNGTAASCGSCTAVALQDTIAGTQVTAPAGVIVRWRFQGEGPVSLVAYRPSERSDSHLAATRVGLSTSASGLASGIVVTATTRIAVAQGDMVGLLSPSGSTIYANANPGDTTQAWGAVDNGSGTIDTVVRQPSEFYYQADIEPDGDGDGFGDETQDKCPGKAGTLDGCVPAPPPPPPPPALTPASLRTSTVSVSSSGKLSVPLVNANPYGVSGKLTLKQRSKKIGRAAAFTLAARASARIAMKLPQAPRAALRRAGRLRVKLTIVTRGAGATRSETRTLTLKRK